MKNNNNYFSKPDGTKFGFNDVSSTNDDLMRGDVGDGVSMDGEDYSNARGDEGNLIIDDDFPDTSSPSYGGDDPEYFAQTLFQEIGCDLDLSQNGNGPSENPIDSVFQVASYNLVYSYIQSNTGYDGAIPPAFVNEVLNILVELCIMSEPSGPGPTMGGGDNFPSDCSEAVNNLAQYVSSLHTTPPLVDAPIPPDYGIDVDNEYAVIEENSVYSMYRASLVNSNFEVYMNSLVVSVLCSTGLGNNIFEMSKNQFTAYLDAKNCQLDIAYPGQDPNYPNPEQPSSDISQYIDSDFSYAGTAQEEYLLISLTNLKNWVKETPINSFMQDQVERLQEGSPMAYQTSNANTNKAIFDYMKLSQVAEFVAEMLIEVGNCIPTNIKVAMSEILAEYIMRNSRFMDISTDAEGIHMIQTIFAQLGYPLPDNFLVQYTALEYNALQSQVDELSSQTTGLMGEISNISAMLIQTQNELSALSNMMEYEQGDNDDLQNQIDMLQEDKAEMEVELMMFMMQLTTAQAQLNATINDNIEMQSDLMQGEAMTQALMSDMADMMDDLENSLQDAEMNEATLEQMTTNLTSQIANSNQEIEMLQNDLTYAITQYQSQIGLYSIEQAQNNQLGIQIANLQSQLVLAIADNATLQNTNTISQADIAHFEQQVSTLTSTNHQLVNTLHELEASTGQSPNTFGGKVKVQGQIDMSTGKGTIQIINGKKPVMGSPKHLKRLNFTDNNRTNDLISMPEISGRQGFDNF